MNPAEAQALLTVAAAFDNRKPDADAAKAWSVALDGMRFEDCRDAIVAHYRGSSEWLMPAKVITEVKRIRAKRIEDHPPLTPPAGLDPVATNRWIREQRWRIGNGEVLEDDARGELKTRHLPDIRELMPKPDLVAASVDTTPDTKEPS